MTDKNFEQQLADIFKNSLATEDEIFVNLEAVKGLKYAQKVMAVLDLSYTLNQTNQMMCQEFPAELREMVMKEQAGCLGNLIANLLGSGDKAPIDEFIKIVSPLVDRRMAAKKAATKLISKLAGDNNV